MALGVERDQEKAASIMEAMYLEFSEDEERAEQLLERLAQLYGGMRMHDRALEVWRKLLVKKGERSSEAAHIYREMAEVYKARGEYGQARNEMMLCLEYAAEPDLKAECMYGLARSLSLLGNEVQARSWLEKVWAMPEADPELKAMAAYMLARILAEQGDKDRARELLLAIKDSYPNPKAVEARLKHLDEPVWDE
jgi:lipopolysaccharide biosynthesis regulator YciM